MLSRNLEQTLHRALALATERRHEYATLEHLLLSLSEDPDAIAVFNACGVDVDDLREALLSFVDNELFDIEVTTVAVRDNASTYRLETSDGVSVRYEMDGPVRFVSFLRSPP